MFIGTQTGYSKVVTKRTFNFFVTESVRESGYRHISASVPLLNPKETCYQKIDTLNVGLEGVTSMIAGPYRILESVKLLELPVVKNT